MRGESYPHEQEFIDYLEVELGLGPLTVEKYSMNLRQFFFFLQLDYFPDGVDVQDIDAGHIRAYLLFLQQERGCVPKTRNDKRSNLNNYFGFLQSAGHLAGKKNPVKNTRKAKVPVRLPVYMTKTEAEAFLRATRFETEFPYRDYAMMKLFLQAGLRVSELTGLLVADLDLDNNSVFVLGKGAKERLLPLTESTSEALKKHLERRPPLFSDSGHVFLNWRKDPMERTGVHRLFHRVLKKAGLEKPGLTVHSLRHTCLTLLLKEGVDIVTLQELAGHKDIDSTSIYTHIVNEDMRKAMDRHPLG